MSTPNPATASTPFGQPPATADEDMIDPSQGEYRVPSADEDPYRPIGEYDPETGKHVAGTPQKATTIGRVTALEKKNGPKGPMLVFSVVATEGQYAGRDFETYVSFSPSARFKVIETYNAIGLPHDGPYPKSAAVGVYVTINLQDEEYNGRWSAKIKSLAAHPKGVGYRGTAALPS